MLVLKRRSIWSKDSPAHGGDPARIEALVRDLQQLRDDADRVAFQEPSPYALREYRRTNRELADAQRALAMVTGR